MVFKDDVKKKIPAYLQDTPEFKVFTALIKKENIRGPASLRAYLEANIEKLKTDFKEKKKANKNGSMNRRLRPIAKKLDFLRLVDKKFVKYL
ncbi:hypothetical protein KY338_00715 [Candidatus Woesearchaeota archaeon]|nr:hypothetical protein [Candidatus Woesearchaeota archaeon]MBW3006431.1 hypothetical protein [Candidatus Woesearchaeota archaeon]